MARNRYIKTYSNYVLKDMHQSTNIGNIYERNFMTIADLNDYPTGSLPSYGLGNFKMIIDDGVSYKKRHRYGSWLKNESCGRVSDYWSLGCLDDENSTTIDTPTLKSNLNSILDYAYFGSATKMVESALVNIANKFPGEIYLREDFIEMDGKNLYLVDNPFNIEFDTFIFDDINVLNPLRIFSKAYENYVIYDTSGLVGSLTWDRNILTNDVCHDNGECLSTVNLGTPFDSQRTVLLYYYVYQGKKTLFHDGTFSGGSIRPTGKVINKFFNELNDFEKLILNKKTNYTALLETPKETEKGNIAYKKPYTWPKTDFGTWNIDINSERYVEYAESLLDISDFYDSYFTNNLWSSLTHEAIVNFDWTLVKTDGGLEEEFSSPDSQRMKAFIEVTGRNFDELKRYIDGIANVNRVTYDESNNNPDIYLVDALMNYGWDVKSPVSSLLNKYMTKALYPGHVDGYTVQDANNEFYRRLLLNSRAIIAAKGTKRAIEMVLSLFGYYSLNFVEHAFHSVKRNDKYVTLPWSKLNEDEKKEILRNVYDITEYVYVADENSKGFNQEYVSKVSYINSLKGNYDEYNSDAYQGLPIREVVTTAEEPIRGMGIVNGVLDTNIIIGYKNVDKNYLIPWFDRTKEYDADIYFESKGGWGLTHSKTNTILDYGDVYYETNNDFKVYDESVKYLKFKENVADLLNGVGESPKLNEVYYVYDISGAKNYDWGILGDEPTQTLSHYFILKSEEHSDVLGVLRDEHGWVRVDDTTGVYIDSDGNIVDRETLMGHPLYPNINWTELPIKYYGWKNVSEEELIEGKSNDAQRIFYMEGITENNLGNNPHVGYGKYDDGESYKVAFEDIFKSARENDEFDYVSDSDLTFYRMDSNGNTSFYDFFTQDSTEATRIYQEAYAKNPNIGPAILTALTEVPNTLYRHTNGIYYHFIKVNGRFYKWIENVIDFNETTPIFTLNKMIDNTKSWYFTDFSEESELRLLKENDDYAYNDIGTETPSIGLYSSVRDYDNKTRSDMGDSNFANELFSSLQYDIIHPYNMEGGLPDDEAAANSIVNSKSLFIEFIPDLQAPISTYEFIDDFAMHYAKQVIPSTTLLKYKVPMTGLDVFCSCRTYLQSALLNN